MSNYEFRDTVDFNSDKNLWIWFFIEPGMYNSWWERRQVTKEFKNVEKKMNKKEKRNNNRSEISWWITQYFIEADFCISKISQFIGWKFSEIFLFHHRMCIMMPRGCSILLLSVWLNDQYHRFFEEKTKKKQLTSSFSLYEWGNRNRISH